MAKTQLRAIKKGEKISITLDVKEYEKLLEDLEELDSIRAYDAAKRSGEAPILFEQAMREIERSSK
jgi:hypothetical protein